MYSTFLDNDYYMFLVSQFIKKYFPQYYVTLKFECRSFDPLVHSDRIFREFDKINSITPTSEEISYLRNLKLPSAQDSYGQVFDNNFLEELYKIDSLGCCIERYDDNLYIYGPWWLVVFVEVPLLASISELHSRAVLNSLDSQTRKDVYERNDLKLLDFIWRVNQNRSLRFNDFGTRRRFSFSWQYEVLKKCVEDIDDSYKFSGTSNVHFARKLDISPVGTFNHGLPMVMSGIDDIMHEDVTNVYKHLQDLWKELYNEDYSILLTDTFTTGWLFDRMPNDVAFEWRGLRHDSGDPYEFGDNYIDLLEKKEVDPWDRVIVFSDSVHIDLMEEILEYFRGKIWVTFGEGQNLTNDTAIKTPDCVIKSYSVHHPTLNGGQSRKVVKFSDTLGKITGDPKAVKRYTGMFNL